MKTYIFIIRRICNITGAQQYVYNKKRFLESQGWRVLVFSSIKGSILIEDFEQYKDNIYASLYYSPSYFRKKDVERTLNSIINKIGSVQADSCVIESDSVPRAIWAELIASRLNCCHLLLSVQERHDYDEDVKEFLRFKYARHELAGITCESVNHMLGDNSLKQRSDSFFKAYCNNVIQDIEDNYSKLLNPDSDYTIGSLGRLDKPCTKAILSGLLDYVMYHSDKSFNIVMIGGGLIAGRKSSLRKKLKKCSNVNLVFTGDVYPVPLSFAKKMDVFVSTAGSSYATYGCGIPTVKMNTITGKPIGIIGLDFDLKEKNLYSDEQDITFADCIERAVSEREKIEYKYSIDENYYKRMNEEFMRQLLFADNGKEREYYDDKLLFKLKRPKLNQLLGCLLLKIFGIGIQEFFWKVFRNADNS